MHALSLSLSLSIRTIYNRALSPNTSSSAWEVTWKPGLGLLSCCNQSDITFSIMNTLELLGRGLRRDSDVRCPPGRACCYYRDWSWLAWCWCWCHLHYSEVNFTKHYHGITKICRLLTSDNGILSLPNTNI